MASIRIVSPKLKIDGVQKDSKARIMVLAINGKQTKNNRPIRSLQSTVFEYIDLQYFPSSIRESQKPSWKTTQPSNQSAVPSHRWDRGTSRSISMQVFLNDLGDRENIKKSNAARHKRKGILTVSSALQFFRDISSPQVIPSGSSHVLVGPPIVAVIGILDLEAFIGVVTSLEINITHWVRLDPTQLTTTGEFENVFTSKRLNTAGAIKASPTGNVFGLGLRPVRATVDITFEETDVPLFSGLPSGSATIKSQQGAQKVTKPGKKK